MGRQLIFCPDVNPHSFVLLFAKGESGASWSIRDYRSPHEVLVRQAREFTFDLDELLRRSPHRIDAPTLSTKDLASWHRHITNANLRCLSKVTPPIAASTLVASRKSHFPLLNEEGLLALSKAAKVKDMDRIFTSPNSEDWVTWNAFALLRQCAPETWWPALVSRALIDRPELELCGGWERVPAITFWRQFAPPQTYEAASRERMRLSDNPAWRQRAKSAKPVEGDSEIDIVLQSPELTVFIEAKLGSDISATTSYDPARNQIIRNIDVLLETCGETQPIFWMLVRDIGSARSYTQLMRQYREEPLVLSAALPHRDPLLIEQISRNLALVKWKDLISDCCYVPTLTPDTSLVHQELLRRI